MQDDGRAQRDIAVLVGGLAFGLMASRMFPLLASASGSIRAQAGGDPFERLRQDHRGILSTLESMQRDGGGSIARWSALFLKLKRKLAKHAMAELDVIYPVLHGEVGEVESTKQLYNEHAEMKIHLFEIEKLLKANTDWTDRVRSLTDLIRAHVREEEDVEFPKLLGLLNERRTRALSGLIRREEALTL